MAALPGEARMDRVYRHQRHIYDFTRRHFLLGRDTLIAALDPPPGGRVLEMGCGTGRNLVVAARRFPHASFHGLDISSRMLETAQANVAAAGLSHRIALAQGDASRDDPRRVFRQDFDRVFFSYTLSMIPEWQAALRVGISACEPENGRMSVVDFGRQEDLPALFRTLLFAWLARFHVTPRAQLPDELRELTATRMASLRIAQLYRGYCTYAELRR